MSGTKRLGYLCLQATREGQASHAHVHEIIRGLERRGWHVRLFEPSYAGIQSGALPGPMGRLAEFRRVQKRAYLEFSNLDVLYVRGHFATWPAVRRASVAGLKTVLEVNGPHEDMYLSWPALKYLRPIVEHLVRNQLQRSDAVIAVTPGLKQWAEREAGVNSVSVIPNGANTSLFSPDAVSPHALPPRFVVFFGALSRWQGIETMLNATREPTWPIDVKLVIIGDGAERGLVADAAREGRVVYLGSQRYREVPGIVARSLAGISVKTDREARSSSGLSPLKVYETLACGVPVIVSDFPGQADLVREHRCGRVIPPANPTELARAVAELAAADQLRIEMGHRGRMAVVQHHSWDHRAEVTDRLLNTLLEGDPSHKSTTDETSLRSGHSAALRKLGS